MDTRQEKLLNTIGTLLMAYEKETGREPGCGIELAEDELYEWDGKAFVPAEVEDPEDEEEEEIEEEEEEEPEDG